MEDWKQLTKLSDFGNSNIKTTLLKESKIPKMSYLKTLSEFLEAINYDPKLEFDNAKKYFEYCSINKLKLGGRIIKLTSTFHFVRITLNISSIITPLP